MLKVLFRYNVDTYVFVQLESLNLSVVRPQFGLGFVDKATVAQLLDRPKLLEFTKTTELRKLPLYQALEVPSL